MERCKVNNLNLMELDNMSRLTKIPTNINTLKEMKKLKKLQMSRKREYIIYKVTQLLILGVKRRK